MKFHVKISLILVFVITAFLAGSWYGHRNPSQSHSTEKRKALYYVDPMNPGHTSDKPGFAPCGMKMEPVYADSGGLGSQRELPPGSVRISSEKQQMIGVRVADVEKTSWTHRIRTYGRVTADERRIYRINASTEGWIRKVFSATTGSLVTKDEPLASFYTTEFLNAQQAYLYALDTLRRIREESPDSEVQQAMINAQLRSAIENLQNMGVSNVQLQELVDRSDHDPDIVLRAPATGFVLLRNASLGQRFEPGVELFQVADLGHVWVIADLFDSETCWIRTGISARIQLPNRGKSLQAVVSDILPQYDTVSRTMKVRLELDNPGFLLRPDMLVDVELAVALPPAVSVPTGAVLDAGTRKVAYVHLGDGVFQPRRVETGWRLDERLEILRGLAPGERVVVSGNFLIDSESRMKIAAAGLEGELEDNELQTANTAEPPEIDSLAASIPRALFIPRLESSRPLPSRSPSKAAAQGEDMLHGAGHGSPGDMEGTAPQEEDASDLDESSALEPGAGAHRPVLAGPGDSMDPVCHMPVAVGIARATGNMIRHNGHFYTFCSRECREKFQKRPELYVSATLPEAVGSEGGPPGAFHPGRMDSASTHSTAGQSYKRGRQQ